MPPFMDEKGFSKLLHAPLCQQRNREEAEPWCSEHQKQNENPKSLGRVRTVIFKWMRIAVSRIATGKYVQDNKMAYNRTL